MDKEQIKYFHISSEQLEKAIKKERAFDFRNLRSDFRKLSEKIESEEKHNLHIKIKELEEKINNLVVKIDELGKKLEFEGIGEEIKKYIHYLIIGEIKKEKKQ